MQGTQRFVWISLGLTAIFIVANLLITPWWTVDDAFISYRYGRNFLEAGEMTWNLGEELPVEGYTGILLPLLAAAFLGLGLPLLTTIKVLGVLSVVSILFLADRIMKRLGTAQAWRSMALLSLAATPLLYMHALSGLETIFFAFLITATFWALVEVKHAPGSMPRSGLLMAALILIGLCRPEGIALATIVVIDVVLWLRKKGLFSQHWKSLPFPAFAWILLIGYWIGRAIYYQSFLPNTYHAKAYDGLLNLDSALALGKFVGYYCLIPLLVAGILHLRKLGAQKQQSPITIHFAYFGFALICAAAYLHSNLWMSYGSRFFFPFLPISIVLIFHWADRNWKAIQTSTPKKNSSGLLISLAFLGLIQAGILAFRYRQEHAFLNYYHAIVQEELIPAGQYLAGNLPPNAIVISYMDAGAVSYYSGLKVIDFGRLNDRYLAQEKPDTASVINYFFNQQADALVMTSQSLTAYNYIPEANQIVKDPRFAAYELVMRWGNSADYPYWQFLYLRKTGP
jgi:arabinofuranosyltransferase